MKLKVDMAQYNSISPSIGIIHAILRIYGNSGSIMLYGLIVVFGSKGLVSKSMIFTLAIINQRLLEIFKK